MPSAYADHPSHGEISWNWRIEIDEAMMDRHATAANRGINNHGRSSTPESGGHLSDARTKATLWEDGQFAHAPSQCPFAVVSTVS
jgi:hypothetical protein